MPATEHLRTQAVAGGAQVLANRPLREGTVALSHFADMTWDLTPAIVQRHGRKLTLNFASLPADFRATAKELFFAVLTVDLPDGEAPLSIATVRSYFSAVKIFLEWAQPRAHALSALTRDHLADYQRHLAQLRISDATRGTRRNAVRLLWLYRDKLTHDHLALDPANLDGWLGGSGRRRSRPENLTERIPEQVLGPLLSWALRWVEEFAGDVLDALAEWTVLQQPRADVGAPLTPDLAALLQRYRDEQRRLPAHPAHTRVPRRRVGTVNLSHLARELGATVATLTRVSNLPLIEQAVDECGLDDDTYLRTRPSVQLAGEPWLARISYDQLRDLARQLHTACYIVIAYLSGMRDSEVKHLRRGCLSITRDALGHPCRRTVASLAFKGETDVTGTPATWIVGTPVERAVRILERLQPAEQPFLFAVLPIARAFRQNRPNDARSTARTTEDLRAFVRWINLYCTSRRCAEEIPHVRGRAWPLSTRQFRRTIAWFIARRPGGVIAGSMQYRHLRVQMFEGYAGTSASGFRAEVEAEEAFQRGEKLVELGAAERQLTGPAAAEAAARLAEFRQATQFNGMVVTDRARMRRILTRHEPNIYPGTYVTCVYNPDRALCRREGDGPALRDCAPLRCRNVALDEDNRTSFTRHLARLDEQLDVAEQLAPYMRHRLESRRTEIAAFLGTHGQEPPR